MTPVFMCLIKPPTQFFWIYSSFAYKSTQRISSEEVLIEPNSANHGQTA